MFLQVHSRGRSRIMGDPRLSPEGGKMYAQSSGFFWFCFFIADTENTYQLYLDKGVVLKDPQTGVLHPLKKENIKQKRC